MLLAIPSFVIAGGLFLLFVWYVVKQSKSLPEIGVVIGSNVKPRDPRDDSPHHFTGPDIYLLKPTEEYLATQPEIFVGLLQQRGYRLATPSEYERNENEFVFCKADYSTLILGVNGNSDRVLRKDINHFRELDSIPLYAITRVREGTLKEAA